MQRFLKQYPVALFLGSFIMLAALGYAWVILAFPGSGFTIQKSDGLIKGVPLRIDFTVRL